MRRVAFVVPWGEALGGAEMMLLSLLRNLDRSRCDPSVFFLRPGPFEQEVAQLDIHTTVVPAGRLREIRTVWRASGALARELDRLDPSVVCSWAAMSHVHAAIARRRRRRARSVDVWWQHCITHGEWLDRVATALPAHAVGCSSHAAAAAQRALRPSRETFVVHPGTAAHPAGPSRNAIRAQFEIADDSFVVGITGRLQPGKNHLGLFEAVAALRAEGLPAHALVVGGTAHGLSPGYPREIDGFVQRLGLEGHVSRLGHVPDARRLLPAMDVLVNASDNEAFGITLIEAMAAAVPVVSVDAGGPREIVEDQASGLLVPSTRGADLAAGLRVLARDASLREQLGKGALRRYEDRFTAAHMAHAFVDAMDEFGAVRSGQDHRR